jgi:hypothetical protein
MTELHRILRAIFGMGRLMVERDANGGWRLSAEGAMGILGVLALVYMLMMSLPSLFQ